MKFRKGLATFPIIRTRRLTPVAVGSLVALVAGLTITPRAVVAATTYTVSTSGDGGPGSLRQAILDANSRAAPTDIRFSIGSGRQTITPVTPLPPITVPAVIDGTSQPGYAGVPLVRVDGASAGPSATGLVLQAGSSTVEGLEVTGWGGAGIELSGTGGGVVAGNDIGTDGHAALPNAVGLLVDSPNNTIGGAGGARNVISGNSGDAISIAGTGNRVEGNYIGTDAKGKNAIGNGTGIFFTNCEFGNTVGGDTASARNIISGNGGAIYIFGASGNRIQGNYIGTDVSGARALGNGYGIGMSEDGYSCTADGNTIGGDDASARNVISGNSGDGVGIIDSGNVVKGNYIGTDASGKHAIGNGGDGVCLCGTAGGNTVGGGTPGARNLISANGIGVEVANRDWFYFGSALNRIAGNYIGTDVTGTRALGNTVGASFDAPAWYTIVGGYKAGEGNLISGNGHGVDVMAACDGGSGGCLNAVAGNYIGTDAKGNVALGNGVGIDIQGGASGMTVGGDKSGSRNVVSGNGEGVVIADGGTTNNRVEGNYIGTNPAGTKPLGNVIGVHIEAGATYNTVGGTTAGTRNVISGNGTGVAISGGGSNRIQGDFIGSDAAGTGPLGNIGDGVSICCTTAIDTIGGTAATAGNTIANNGGAAVRVSGTFSPAAINDNVMFANRGGGIVLIGISRPAPSIVSAAVNGGATVISGTIASGSYRIEIFANLSCTDPEGKQFLGFVNTATGSWSFTVPIPLASGSGVTATATRRKGSTSHYSPCVSV